MGRRLIGSFNVSAAGAAPMHTVEEKERERGRVEEGRAPTFVDDESASNCFLICCLRN